METVESEYGIAACDARLTICDRKESPQKRPKSERLDARCADMRARQHSGSHTHRSPERIVQVDNPLNDRLPKFFRATEVCFSLGISYRTLMRLLKHDLDVRYIGEKKPGVRLKRTPLIPASSIDRLLDRLTPR